MGEKLNRLLDLLILIGVIVIMVITLSCTKEELYTEQIPTLELDGRLPMDENGYYHLKLNPTTNQTIHRITGKVLNTTQPTKVSWHSNLYWWILKGQSVVNITKTYINYFTGELTYVNLPPLTNWQNVMVPTINGSSYVNDKNEINTIIAPIFDMRYDTLRVKSTINEWNIIQEIKIVLE